MSANFNKTVTDLRDYMNQMEEEGKSLAPLTPAERSEKQAHNLREWSLAYKQAGNDKAKTILMDELKAGGGTDFPIVKGVHDADVMQFKLLTGQDGGQQSPEPDKGDMQFHVLRAVEQAPASQPAPQFDRGVALPGEQAETPAGAVTGRTMVPSPRDTSAGAPFNPNPAATADAARLGGRVAVETGATFLGGTVGGGVGAFGAPLATRNPQSAAPGAVAGMRIGEAVGAFGGSLLSEAFDPTPHPFHEAAKAASLVLGTGMVSDASAGIARRMIGRPSEGGQYLMSIMQAKGQVPTPGAVLDSEFIKNTQSFGSAAFGTSELLKEAQTKAEGISSDAVRQYVSGFQRYHDSASKAFQNVDGAFAQARIPNTANVTTGNAISGAATTTMPTLGSRFWLKGDEKARDAVLDVAENWVNRTGRADAMPTGLQKMYAWAQQGGAAPKFTFNETQQVYDALYNKARALDRAAKNHDVTELAGTNTAAYVREQAKRVKQAFDDQLDAAINNKAIDPAMRAELGGARANWRLWVQGQEMERMVAASTKDLAGNEAVKGSKLLNELDKMLKEDAKIGTRTLDQPQVDGMRRYALALKSLEDADKAGGYVFAGRMGQLVGITSAGAALLGHTSGLTAAGGFMGLAPHVIAWTFSNPTASALLIRGLKVDPGTAAGMRVMRELGTLWEKEGLMGPNDDEGPQLPAGGHPDKKVPQ